MVSSKRTITILILLFIFFTRLPYLSNSPFELGESWRQSDTESMARNFVEERFHILFPQLNYDGAPPNYVQLEFQITTFLIAILYKLFGFHYELARIVPILFFVGSSYYLYLIAKKYYSTEIAWMSMLLYSLFPLNVYFSRAIMPESAALIFYIGAFYYFCEWIDKEKNWQVIVASVMTALAIAVKTPTIFIGIPMLIMSIVKFKKKIFTTWQLYLFATISLIVPFIYFKWLETVAQFTFVSSIGTKHIIPQFATAIFTEQAREFFQTHLPQSFTMIALVLAIIGMFIINWKTEYPIGVWMLAIILEVITIVAVIRFNYYLVFISPVMAIIASKALAICLRWKYGVLPIVVILTIISYMSYQEVQPKFEEKTSLLKQAQFVKQYTDKDDLIVVGTFSPELLNASERKGWRANIKYYDYIPEGPEAELNYFIEHGAKYFVPSKGYIYDDHDHAYRNYLETHFEKIPIIEEDGDYSIYKLQ